MYFTTSKKVSNNEIAITIEFLWDAGNKCIVNNNISPSISRGHLTGSDNCTMF